MSRDEETKAQILKNLVQLWVRELPKLTGAARQEAESIERLNIALLRNIKAWEGKKQ